MKIVYQKSIADLILKAKKKSVLSGKEIKHIELSEKEAVELFDLCFQSSGLESKEQKIKAANGSWLYGLHLVVLRSK